MSSRSAVAEGFLHGGSSDVDGLVAVAVDAFDHAGVSMPGKIRDVFSGDTGVREQSDGGVAEFVGGERLDADLIADAA